MSVRVIAAVVCALAGAAEGADAALPLAFERNTGRAGADVEFLGRGPAYDILFSPGEAVLVSAAGAVRIAWPGANRRARIHARGESTGTANYLTGQREEWRTGIPLYSAIQYDEIYPGIDLVFYGSEGRLEYDFIVRPGADPERIRIRFDGAEDLRLDDGELVARAADGELRQHRPRVYQERPEGRAEVRGEYVLAGRYEAGFRVAPYDKRRALVIDPVLSYSTYLGGSGDDRAWGIAVDGAGCAYVAGETWSANFPRSTAPARTSGNQEAFVVKLNAAGTGIVYATFFGGVNRDSARAIAVDAAGNAYIAGFTYSADFPTTAGAYRTTAAGQEDAFVAKLNPAGTALIYSTVLGGPGSDFATGIAVDAAGSAYVSGYTSSVAFPVTAAAAQRNFGGGYQDAFAAKLNAVGSSLIYASYLGGAGNDFANGIAVDQLGFAHVVGYTDSTNFPVRSALWSAAQGQGDGFIVKLNPAGDSLAYGTYIGGRQRDNVTAVALDMSGNAYITGSTLSVNFPVSLGAYQASSRGHYDAFLMKVNVAGTSLVYSTYLGGTSADEGTAVSIQPNGAACIAGYTFSNDFPIQSAVQSVHGGATDSFLASFSDSGALVQSTYLGGAGEERASSLATDVSGNLYAGGYTLSFNFPNTAGSVRSSSNGGVDAFVVKLSNPTSPAASAVFIKTDTTTQGGWKSSYGGDGVALADDLTHYPDYVNISFAKPTVYVWSATTTDSRALQGYSSIGRTAATWFSESSLIIDLDFDGDDMHPVAIYCLDWDSNGARSQRVDVVDAANGRVLDTRVVTNFAGGKYLVWNIIGHVVLHISRIGGANAVVSGLFFGGGASRASAVYEYTDTVTQGAWKGRYGRDGAVIPGHVVANPPYSEVSFGGQAEYVWSFSTPDARALQKYLAEDRIAATWFSESSFRIDVAVTDGASHRIAVYCLDWDSGGKRAQRIDVVDASTGTILDTRSIGEFAGGQYIVWHISGHIRLEINRTAGANAVVGGLLFQ